MAFLSHENAISRLQGEVKGLWRRVGEVGGVGEGGRGAWVGVGGQGGSKPSDEACMGAARTPSEPNKVGLWEAGLDGAPTQGVRDHLLNLREEIQDLEGGLCSLTVTDSDTPIMVDYSKMKDIQVIMTKVMHIRSCFKALKENGQMRFVYLENVENGLAKDIKALRESLTEDQNHSKVVHGTEVCSNVDIQNSVLNQDEQVKTNTRSHDVIKPRNVLGNVQSKIDNGMPRSVPQFQHNWEERDHQTFVKILKKYKTWQRRKEEWQRTLMFKSELEIETHAAQYDIYVKEKNKWQEQLDQWKEEKEFQRKEHEKKVAEQQKCKEEEKQMRNKAKEERLRRERAERFQKLALWKASKECCNKKEQIDSSAEVRVDKSSIIVKPQSYSKEERQIIAMQLDEYRQQKDEVKRIEMERKQEELREQRNKYNACSREEFRRKDEDYVRSLKEQKEYQMKLKEEQNRKLEKIKSVVRINAVRDKDRLLQPTQSRIAYAGSQKEGDKFKANNVDNITRLATPSWRCGL